MVTCERELISAVSSLSNNTWSCNVSAIERVFVTCPGADLAALPAPCKMSTQGIVLQIGIYLAVFIVALLLRPHIQRKIKAWKESKLG